VSSNAAVEEGEHPLGWMLGLSAFTLILDQATKVWATRLLRNGEELEIVPGFFRLVHWQNTGAAWSLFTGKNDWLATISIVSLVALFYFRHYFDAHTRMGRIALGLLFGGIAGNVIDRFRVDHVIDFIYFYAERRGGGEVGFPAFNVADATITAGVVLLLWMSWRKEEERDKATLAASGQDEAKPERSG